MKMLCRPAFLPLFVVAWWLIGFSQTARADVAPFSISPASGAQGASVQVTLTGTGFAAGATVATTNPGIIVGGVTVVSATQITANFTIAADAAPGYATVTVTTGGRTLAGGPFAVNPAAPTLTSVNPASGVQGATVPVTLTGSNFVSGASVATNNPGITVSNVVLVSTTQITASFAIAGTATTGAANVTVTTSGGTSTAAVFTVTPAAPSISITIRPTYWQGDLNDDGVVDLADQAIFVASLCGPSPRQVIRAWTMTTMAKSA